MRHFGEPPGNEQADMPPIAILVKVEIFLFELTTKTPRHQENSFVSWWLIVIFIMKNSNLSEYHKDFSPVPRGVEMTKEVVVYSEFLEDIAQSRILS